MKLSEVNVNDLSLQEKKDIVFNIENDITTKCDVCFLLGSNIDLCKERSRACAKAYKEGRIKKIIATGGVKRDGIPEAEIMKKMLVDLGVKEEDILLELESTDTLENMIYSFPLMYKHFKFEFNSIMIVTSKFHMRRSLIFAKFLIPEWYHIIGYYPEDTIDDNYLNYMNVEVETLKRLINAKVIKDDIWEDKI